MRIRGSVLVALLVGLAAGVGATVAHDRSADAGALTGDAPQAVTDAQGAIGKLCDTFGDQKIIAEQVGVLEGIVAANPDVHIGILTPGDDTPLWRVVAIYGSEPRYHFDLTVCAPDVAARVRAWTAAFKKAHGK